MRYLHTSGAEKSKFGRLRCFALVVQAPAEVRAAAEALGRRRTTAPRPAARSRAGRSSPACCRGCRSCARASPRACTGQRGCRAPARLRGGRMMCRGACSSSSGNASRPLDHPPDAVVAERDLAVQSAVVGTSRARRPPAGRPRACRCRGTRAPVTATSRSMPGNITATAPTRLRDGQAVVQEQAVPVGLVVALGGGRGRGTPPTSRVASPNTAPSSRRR